MNEFIGDWVIGSKVSMVDGCRIQVQLIDDSVREVHRRPTVDFSSLWFTDCTHPAQNAYCPESKIKAWRLH